MKFFLINFFFITLTLLSFVFSFLRKKYQCLYFIAFKGKNLRDIIDSRSHIYCEIKNIKKSICIIRCYNIKSAIILFFKYQNIFIINSIEYFFSKEKTKLIIGTLFRFCRIKNFFMLDDYRYLNLFLPICRNLNVVSHGYMHGRFSKNLNFQNSLFKNKFDFYYVWSFFFKKKMLKLNSLYTSKNIIILKKNKLKFYFKNRLKKTNFKNILFLEENKISENILISFVKKIKHISNYNFYYKVRPNNHISKSKIIKLEKNNIEVLDNVDLKKIIINKKINFVFGFNSSFLYISSLLNLIPISLNNKHLLIDLKYEKAIFLINPKSFDINKQINLLLNNKVKLLKLKRKIWK